MTYAHKLKYAGAKPYQPEADRVDDPDDDLTYREYEHLTQDETYQRLAEVRWLASELDDDLHGDYNVPEAVREHVFDAVANRDAPLAEAVDEYVAHFRAELDLEVTGDAD